MQDAHLAQRHEWDILRLSVALRLCTLGLAFVTSALVPAWDTSSVIALARPASSQQDSQLLLENGCIWSRLALTSTQWDTLHFLAIARNGYTNEQNFAFLPGSPGLLATAGRLPGLAKWTDEPFDASFAVVIVSGLATLLSSITPLVFYRLSVQIFQSRRLAKTAALLYTFSPAPAVLCVPYTEPFFAFFSLLGMLYLARPKKAYIRSALCFAMAGTFRANGILNVGFLVWHLIWRMQRPGLLQMFRNCILLTILASLVVSPFILHQAYAYLKFCTNDTKARPWCTRTLPIAYSFVQERYWDVGLFRYWTLQQLPNFALAAPVLLASFTASFAYYHATWPACLSYSMPFTSFREPAKTESSRKSRHPFFNLELVPYLHLHTALALVLLFASHVQIALRQACTSPVIFWYMAHLVEQRDKRAKWWVYYCVIWGAVSVVLWTAFYPPA